jgi:hypothetical protein
MKNDATDKVVLKVYKEGNGEKRAHNCYLCQIYKREASNGDIEALQFYKTHLNQVVRKYGGITIVLNRAHSAVAIELGKKRH